MTRLDTYSAAQRIANLSASPHHYIFHEMKTGTVSIPSGTTTTNILLSALGGSSAGIIFTIRSSIVNAGAWNYTAISSFNLLDPAGAP